MARSVGHNEETRDPADDVLDRMGLTAALPDQLIQDEHGQRFEPVQLQARGNLGGHLDLLSRAEPVGGAEPLIQINQQRATTHALEVLHHDVAGATLVQQPDGTTMRKRRYLQHIQTKLLRRKERFEARSTRIDERYAQTQKRLHTWQQHATNGTGGLLARTARILLGGDAHMSVLEAAMVWNQREQQALLRASWAAACTVVINVLEQMTRLSNDLDARLEECLLAQTTLRQQERDLQRGPGCYAPWSMTVQSQVIVDALVSEVDLDTLQQALLQCMTAEDAPPLLEQVRTLAQQETARRLESLSITDVIGREAHASGLVPEVDPLVLIGQAHLTTVQRPTWQLVRGARPRIETVQVTPDGAPVYHLDGLSSAAYDGPAPRLGFVQVQLGVAVDELAMLRDSDEAFQAALAQRNLYVLEDLAQPVETAPRPDQQPEAESGLATHPTNGRVEALER